MSGRPSEEELIAAYFAPLAGRGSFGLRDDAALFSPASGEDLVLTKDILIGGVHFFANDPPDAIARKALRVNLSDLAAKGANPAGYLLGLALPQDWTADWLAAFAAGLGEDAGLFECPLLGGDTSKTSGPLLVSVTALGRVPESRMVRREGAALGDVIYVSGTIGDAALGLKLRQEGGGGRLTRALGDAASAFLIDRYLLPQPRLALASALRTYAHAAMDVSDGLAGDLGKMLRLTGMTAEIAVEKIPFSAAGLAALSHDPGLIEIMVTGGDDYEILAAVAPSRTSAFEAAAAAAGVAVYSIGLVSSGTGAPSFRAKDGAVLEFAEPSFRHF
jgi:thiamine-monophosphate kinase